MALLGNKSILLKAPLRHLNGSVSTAGSVATLRGNFNQHGMMRNAYQSYSPVAAIPNGHNSPSAWVQPKTAGGMSTFGSVRGSGGAMATPQAGQNIDANLTGQGDITDAPLGLIVTLIATIIGSGNVSSATANALATMVATLTGSSSVAATLQGLAQLGATLTGSGNAVGGNTALMDITATIRGYGDLTPEGIRDSVWSAILANYPNNGTAGKALSTAGSGGVDLNALAVAVWEYATRTLTSGGGGATAGEVADAVRTELQAELLRIVELAQIHGLVVGTDLVVTPTSRVAGSIVQTISGDGTTTVSRA